jgi:putative transposase
MLLRSWSRDSIVYRGARGAKRPTSSAAGLHISQRPWSVFGKKRGKNGKVGPPVHADLVERDFTAEALNRLWLADITEHPTP